MPITTWRAPTAASSVATSRRSASAAAAKRARSFSLRVSTRSCASGLRVDEPELAGVRQLLLARVADLDGDHLVPPGELEQRPAPVAWAAEVGDDHDERALPRERVGPAEGVAERGGADPARRKLRLLAERGQQTDEPDSSLPYGEGARLLVAERERAEPVAPAGGDVADRDRDALRDIRLATVGGAEAHRRGRVEHEPRDEHPLGELDADVRLAGTGGHVPVDPADVVARDVRTDQRQLGSVAEERRAVVAGEQALHAPPDRDVERAKQPVRDRPRAGTGRRRCGGGRRGASGATPSPRTNLDSFAVGFVLGFGSHAALVSASSSCGTGTAARTRWRIVSGLTSSASAWYERTSRWRSASSRSEWRSSSTT